MKFLIRNFGCRATQADGAELAAALAGRGCHAAHRASDADLVILNTCTVTASADEDVRREVRRVRRANPAAQIVVTGCYAQRVPGEAARLPGVSFVVGNPDKMRIPEILGIQCGPEPGSTIQERTRPNLKIQDGCNSQCTFCIIPSLRGRSTSSPPGRVVQQVRELAGRYREVVLSGVNLGRWGREPAIRMRLADLLRRLLAETQIERLRLSSVEPMDLTGDLLGLMASTPRIAKHVHAPLQSGSDAVLRRMRRWYRARHYADRIWKAREWMPEAAIGADVLVGFPGETEAEFDQTRTFIEALPFTYLHVFTYSERPGTPAAEMPGQVPVRERKRRNRVLREIAAAKNLGFRRSLAGKRLSAVTIDDGSTALTTNYLKVRLAPPREPNQMIEVELGEGLAAG
ncbi:MAG TPA: tRNA (N(6)-L-threonylcarbamoyladenosine(37)-C(2))-methylthiotransferase MtaB [Bryobacteraceae bacterium]|nr:tRNA (N(6)-L-threonylcarbamoyladenosine(37)-C(2))-methylthiotransferase MtaB [Bryobacteraceae bacterium]